MEIIDDDGRSMRAIPITEEGVSADAYAMYMRYIPEATIAKELAISDKKLKKIIRDGGWKKERENLHKDIKKAVKTQAITRLNSITTNGLHIIDVCIKLALKSYKEDQRAPSFSEAEMIMKMVKTAHSIRAFEEGQGAGGEASNMAPEEVLDAFRNDPYMRKILKEEKQYALPEGNEEDGASEDTFSRGDSDKSASQEARASFEGVEF
jgi:hypothetical protein